MGRVVIPDFDESPLRLGHFGESFPALKLFIK